MGDNGVKDGVQKNIVSVMDIITDYANSALKVLPDLLTAVVVFVIFWFLAKAVRAVVSRIVRRTMDDQSLRSLFSSTAWIVVVLAGAFISAAIVFPGLDAGTLVSVLGLSSVAVGFAFKEIFQDFFSGVLILLRRPFRIGDQIVVGADGIDGHVEDIGFRHTTIKTYSNQLILVPNSRVFTNPITVRTALKRRRSAFFTGIAYDEDIEQGRKVIQQALDNCEHVHKEPSSGVYVSAHDASAITFEVLYWHDAPVMKERIAKDEVATKIKAALDEAGISIPFPQRTLHVAPSTMEALTESMQGSSTKSAKKREQEGQEDRKEEVDD